ncbi:hypothetical protein REG_0321 [Candidatus Regiella insecticola LSR1]|uniref:CS1 type fimbrial major subunit n=1 Tax=Candidatus Regiella insecticola LSR1 TaxID=663321 RepID=E0WQW9_9ENTR|nr:CS1 type fimbrial major subunit [Candidatus Regiella insecticola]EFL92529.1 hypothetical protein REG_0321 [Candidatus Regiella insecticola LSR1]
MKKIITKNAPLFATAVLALSTLFTASHANSVENIQKQNLDIPLELKVPSDDFSVAARNGFSLGQSQEMAYDPIQKKLNPLTIPLLLKSKSGEIKASLNGDIKLINDLDPTKSIEMKASIGNVELKSTKSQDIGEKERNKIGSAVNLVISAKVPGEVAKLTSGYYQGTVSIMFEGDIAKA